MQNRHPRGLPLDQVPVCLADDHSPIPSAVDKGIDGANRVAQRLSGNRTSRVQFIVLGRALLTVGSGRTVCFDCAAAAPSCLLLLNVDGAAVRFEAGDGLARFPRRTLWATASVSVGIEALSCIHLIFAVAF